MQKTWEEIEQKLKCMQAIMALHRIWLKKESNADKMLIGSIVNDHFADPYQLEFDAKNKTVLIASCWNYDTSKYYRVSSFYLHDVFMGVQ